MSGGGDDQLNGKLTAIDKCRRTGACRIKSRALKECGG